MYHHIHKALQRNEAQNYRMNRIKNDEILKNKVMKLEKKELQKT